MGFLDFLFGGTPWQYKRIVKVFSNEVPITESLPEAESRLNAVVARLLKGGPKDVAAGKALQSFVAKGGAKYFVKKQ